MPTGACNDVPKFRTMHACLVPAGSAHHRNCIMSVDATPETAEPPTGPLAPARPAKPCANCGAPMYGPFCYACGQPEKGMIRHLASVMADVADTIFNVDSRIFRSIPALYFRPGFLTNEYFAGRRTRYVTPFRLFFFLCVIAFFAIQGAINFTSIPELGLDQVQEGVSLAGIASAQTPQELDERTQKFIAALEAEKNAATNSPKAAAKVDKNIESAKEKSQARRAWLLERAKAVADGKPTPPDPSAHASFEFDGVPWKPTRDNTRVSWLPDFVNAKLYATAQHAMENVDAAKRDPSHLIAGIFSVLPQTLFVLMPLFALLLKIAYLFKRRLYMEHLMVALHSHAFIFLSLLFVVLVTLLSNWAATHAGALVPLLRLLYAAIWTWLFVYLFLMAKKVYRQGWFMTTVKFCFVGFCYMILLSFGIAGAVIASLAVT